MGAATGFGAEGCSAIADAASRLVHAQRVFIMMAERERSREASKRIKRKNLETIYDKSFVFE